MPDDVAGIWLDWDVSNTTLWISGKDAAPFWWGAACLHPQRGIWMNPTLSIAVNPLQLDNMSAPLPTSVFLTSSVLRLHNCTETEWLLPCHYMSHEGSRSMAVGGGGEVELSPQKLSTLCQEPCSRQLQCLWRRRRGQQRSSSKKRLEDDGLMGMVVCK